MGALLARVDAGEPVRWLDFIDYGGALLAAGTIPWLDVADYIAWYRKAQGLLKSDVVAFPVMPLAAAWLASHAGLRKEMAKRQRPLAPLKALLADAALRSHLAGTLASLRSVYPDMPLALVMPLPQDWVASAYALAFGAGEQIAISIDEADSAAMYVADFLRVFADVGVDILLMEELGEAEGRAIVDVESCRTILNVAAHYRWETGIRLLDGAPEWKPTVGLDFVLAPGGAAGSRAGLVLGAGFWEHGGLPVRTLNDFYFAIVPDRAQPETVLERLAALR